jgi:hypothetical protein
MKTNRTLTIFALSLALALTANPAWAAEFSPTADLSLSSNRVRANPKLTIAVAQDMDEEELKSVILRVDEGFKLAKDGALEDGEELGSGDISIHAGPRCAGQTPVSGPVNVPVNIVERDRTQEEVNRGVKAVYVVDLRPVTTIDLLVKGSVQQGWTLKGTIPANELTCPPFSFEATIDKRAGTSGTKIVQNPGNAGRYSLSITFNGLDGSRKTVRQQVRIRR